MKNKQTKIIIALVAVLTIAVLVFAYINKGDVEIKKGLEMNSQFQIKYGDKIKTITMEEFLTFEPTEFETIMDTSTTDPTPVKFTGVELKKICEKLNIDISKADTITAKALDGYSSALSIDEVNEDNNVYVCIKKDGEPLKTKAQGSFGPYMVVINNSTFSQRWCKFLQEIII